MTGECSYHDRCKKIPIELKQCSSNPLCRHLLHYSCQAKYEYELGIELIEIKYQCRPCIDKHIDTNRLSLSKNTSMPINKHIHQSLTPAMDVVALSKMTSFNDSYKSDNSSESHNN